MSVGVRTLWDEVLPIELSEPVLRMRLGRGGKQEVSVDIMGSEVIVE